MSRETRVGNVVVVVCAVLWMSFWFWAFSFAYSDSFFEYNRHSRLPPFAAALMGAGGIFASFMAQWRGRRTVLVACLRHVMGVAVSFGPLVIVSAALVRASGPWRPSADDAMGVGIDFMILAGVGIASIGVLAVAVALRNAGRSREHFT